LFAATFNPEYADLLFAGSGHTSAEIAVLAKDRKPLPRFALPVSIRAKAQVLTDAVHSNNLVAVIPGRDPKLRSEYVVLSAHLDHLGIGQPINGDRIYNGAMDNASGAAMLLDVARSLQRNKIGLRRSVLFVWVTGEEKGLLGSRYFASRPTGPAAKIVADLNTDMFRYHAPSDDLDQPVDLAAAGRFEDVMFALTVEVADDPARPAWKSDSFFKRFAR